MGNLLDTPSHSGIYKIVNSVNGKIYIGSSIDITSRRRQHIQSLRAGTHQNKKLQADVNHHGIEAFSFEIMELFEGDGLKDREMELISQAPDEKLYNKVRCSIDNIDTLKVTVRQLKHKTKWLEEKLEIARKETDTLKKKASEQNKPANKLEASEKVTIPSGYRLVISFEPIEAQ